MVYIIYGFALQILVNIIHSIYLKYTMKSLSLYLVEMYTIEDVSTRYPVKGK
jgi:hypothetical protein